MDNRLCEIVAERLGSDPIEKGVATFLNPYSYLRLRSRPDLVQEFDRIYFDGISMVWLGRLLGVRCDRQSFDQTGLAGVVLDDAARRGLSVAFIGGEAGIAAESARILAQEHHGLRVTIVSPGFFESRAERAGVIDRICEASVDLVVVGMGVVAQEAFVCDLIATGWRGVAYTCGGYLRQTCKAGLDYYPDWADRLNLRWLYRIIDEPVLLRRYTIEYPRALARIVSDFVAYRFRRLAR